jgi:amidase
MIRFILCLFTIASIAMAQDLSGAWMARVYDSDPPTVGRLQLRQEAGKLTGTFGGRSVEGTINGDAVLFKDESTTVAGRFAGGKLSGEVTRGSRTVKWEAERLPPRPATSRTHDFEPSAFELYFSSAVKPVLRIAAGDTVRTWGVDAGGNDKDGKRRSPGGNPQTGPFYVEGALPGDTLVVRLNRIRLNRDWAVSGTSVMRNALEPFMLGGMKWTDDFPNRWKLDRQRNVAVLEKPTDKLKEFTVPLRPMLGCVAVAPPGRSSVRTTDSGRFGGNMDYNEIREGTTLYLPVYHAGALLFLGDGHGAQGDGELTGDALETSTDFEFTVDVIEGKGFCGLPDQHRNRGIARPGVADGDQRNNALPRP